MANKEPNYQEILKRIHTTPSLLFLGQNYLSEALYTLELSKNDDSPQYLFNYKDILSLKWNAIVSSSFDANIPDKCGESFSFEVRTQYDKSQKINKSVNAGYFLFGQSRHGKTPSKPDLDLDSSSKDIFLSVLKKAIDSYGIIIISGWNFETDWITPQILYDVLKDAPAQSVLLFGTHRQNALKNKFIKELAKKQLSEDDIIETPFYSFLKENDFFDIHCIDDNFSLNTNIETLSLYSEKYKHGRIPFVLRIQKDTIYELASKAITFITDTTGINTVSKNDKNLLYFCACKGDWSYYAAHNKFVINRKVFIDEKNSNDFYDYLNKLIGNITKKNKRKSNHYICIKGIHYSGKTTLLKNFALRSKNKQPIFYVENYEEGLTENLLRDFCSNLINLPEEFSQEVIVICDFKANSDYEMQKICLKIKNTLSEISGISPIVIGTIYSKYEFYRNQLKIIDLSENIDVEEFDLIKSVYGAELDAYAPTENVSIFEMISRLYKYRFSPEAADVRSTMNTAHSINLAVSQKSVNIAYGQIFNDHFDMFIKKGILSSFNESLNENDKSAKEIKDNLKNLNDCIALASEFTVDLPNSFIFRCLNWNNYKFLDALNADCFLIQTENGYRYVNAYEAGKYLLFNYTNPTDTMPIKEMELRKKEVAILCNIIQICNWNDYDESSSVISLIRKFSPKSKGKERNIIGNDDINSDPRGRNWYYYKSYYKQIGEKILECTTTNVIAVIVASAFLRRTYQSLSTQTDKHTLMDISYNHCKEILDSASFEFISPKEKIEFYIEICNVIITTFDLDKNNFSKWYEFTELFHCLVGFYDKTDKLDASVILNIWHRAAKKRASIQHLTVLDQTIFYDSEFLPNVSLADDFTEELKKYEDICSIYSTTVNFDSYKKTNLTGWLLYQQRESYQLEPANYVVGKKEIALAKQILSVFNENEETKEAVLKHPLLLKTKILCDWIIKFSSLPYAEENPISFTDTVFWGNLLKNIDTYLALCDKKNAAAFIKYLKCVWSLVFDDGSYRFEENLRYSKKLSPWYLKRIGVGDDNRELLKFIIGTTPQRNVDTFRGKISDPTSILKNLNYIHLSPEVQKYLSEGKLRLTAMNSITDKPVNIFFNAAGATAAIPRKEGGDNV